MSGINGRLERWKSPHDTQSSFMPVQIQKTAIDIESKLGDVELKKPSEYDLEKSYNVLHSSFINGNNLQDIDRRTLRRAPWVIFEPMKGELPLADNRDFVDAYLNRVVTSARSILITGLAQALLMLYPRSLRTLDICLRTVKVLLRKCNSPRCRRFLDCSKAFGIFESNGPFRLWYWFSQKQGAFDVRMQETCLSGALLKSGFLEAVYYEALKATKAGIGTSNFNDNALDSLFILASEEQANKYDFRFRSAQSQKNLAESLLLPFHERNIEKRIKERIQEFTLNLYGDPRIDRPRWQGVDEAAIRIVLSWLVEDTLEDFFRLLEYFARGDDIASRHWRYRKAFWSAYLNKGVIQDAWVVLAPSLDLQAKQMLKTENRGYGRLRRGSGVLRNHSALIMKINNLIITEWSHSGRYRIWVEELADSNYTPSLYKAEYSRNDLVIGASKEDSHTGTENGRWQTRLEEYIRSKTGIAIRFKEFMP